MAQPDKRTANPLKGKGMTAPKNAGDVAGATAAEVAPQRQETRLPISVVVILALLLIAAAAYTGYWMVAAAQLETRLAGWIDERQGEGYRVDHGAITNSGFPRWVRLNIAGAEIAAPAGWGWKTTGLSIEADPLAPRELRLNLFGQQDVRLPPGWGTDRLTAQAERLSAELDPRYGAPVGSLIADQLTLRFDGATAEGDAVHVRSLELVAAPVASTPPSAPLAAAATSRHYSVSLADLVLPVDSQWPLGNRIAQFAFTAQMTGDLDGGQWPAALVRWRDDGGTIEISNLSLAYASLGASGDGTIALDRAGEPIGAFALQVSGLPETLRQLADKGMISPLVAAGASLVFRPAKGRDKTGAAPAGTAPLSVPVSVQDRKLYIGPLAIARMPSPPWVPLPAPPPAPAP